MKNFLPLQSQVSNSLFRLALAMDAVIEVKDVHKSFKTVQAVRGIDLAIRKGQFTAILGPNGAGKTTLVE